MSFRTSTAKVPAEPTREGNGCKAQADWTCQQRETVITGNVIMCALPKLTSHLLCLSALHFYHHHHHHHRRRQITTTFPLTVII